MSIEGNEFSKKNHGIVITKQNGTRIKEAYGKDDSDVTGSAKDERRRDDFGGGMDNLDHSLKGTSANQSGTSSGKPTPSQTI